MLSETSLTATNSPNFLETSSIRIYGSARGSFHGAFRSSARAATSWRLLAGRELLPPAGHDPRSFFGVGEIRDELDLDFLRRIDARVFQHFLLHVLRGLRIAVRVVHRVGD